MLSDPLSRRAFLGASAALSLSGPDAALRALYAPSGTASKPDSRGWPPYNDVMVIDSDEDSDTGSPERGGYPVYRSPKDSVSSGDSVSCEDSVSSKDMIVSGNAHKATLHVYNNASLYEPHTMF